MTPTLQITQDYNRGTYFGSRPITRINPQTGKLQIRVNKADGRALIMTESGFVVNSQLRRDEWQLLDQRIQMAALTRLRGVEDLRSRGLTVSIGSFGVLTTQWNQANEMTAANASMTGQGAGERDRIDFKIAGRPIPIVFKDFAIPRRQLEAARLMGNQLDTTHATAAARVVAEKLESMLFNGDSTILFDGNTLYGYTTETNRNTGTAASFGGGDWSTISNIIPTVEGMINTAVSDRYYGPYLLYAASTQYNEATLKRFSDGSGQRPSDFIMQMPQIAGFYPSDDLADGVILLVQASEDVVDWAEHMMISTVEWMSGDGMVSYFRVMAVATPRVKSDYGGRSGIVHATGA